MDVPDLRVAHESIAKTDGNAVRVKGTVAVVLGNLVHVGGVGRADGVALHALLWGDTPAIVDAVSGAGGVSGRESAMASLGDTHMRQTLFSTLTIVYGR